MINKKSERADGDDVSMSLKLDDVLLLAKLRNNLMLCVAVVDHSKSVDRFTTLRIHPRAKYRVSILYMRMVLIPCAQFTHVCGQHG